MNLKLKPEAACAGACLDLCCAPTVFSREQLGVLLWIVGSLGRKVPGFR